MVFDLDSAARGFRAAELRGAYIVRYKRPGFAFARDTVRRQLRPASSLSNGFDRYQLSLAELHWPGGISYVPDTLMAHNYRLVLPAASRQYDLSNLEISIAIGTSGCCNCPTNVRRRLLLNGQPIVADGGGENTSVVVRR
ncbi:MAG: hypothetical protein EOO56_20845 [Hymenobacter sp.]|nr:MAG: hypothetical protein EOO56_20845 [Hymenobacter sp.]